MQIIAQVLIVSTFPKGHYRATNWNGEMPVGVRGKNPCGMRVGLGAPVECHWPCGSDVVWPVLAVNGKRLQPDKNGNWPYLCRHLIVAGD